MPDGFGLSPPGSGGGLSFEEIVEKIESFLFKVLKVETVEKIKKIIGAALFEITGIQVLKGVGFGAGAELTQFELVLARTIRAAPAVFGGGHLVFSASESSEELKEATVNNYKPVAFANFLLLTCKEPGITKITGVNSGFEVNGNPLFIFNNNATGSGKNITPVPESALSEESHRFAGIEKTIEPQQCAIFIYAETRWRRIV